MKLSTQVSQLFKKKMYLQRTAVCQCRAAYRYCYSCTNFVLSNLRKCAYENIICNFVHVFSKYLFIAKFLLPWITLLWLFNASLRKSDRISPWHTGRQPKRKVKSVNTARQLVQCTPKIRYHIVVTSESLTGDKKKMLLGNQKQHYRKHIMYDMYDFNVASSYGYCTACTQLRTALKRWAVALPVIRERNT